LYKDDLYVNWQASIVETPGALLAVDDCCRLKGERGSQRQEVDKDGDGKTDLWITRDADGRASCQEEDQDFDGKPDLISSYLGGTLRQLRQDSKLKGCFDLEESYDANGELTRQLSDENGDCRIDLWSGLKNGKVVWQAKDQRGAGRATVLTRYDSSGAATVQELVAEGKHNPDKKLFINADGSVRSQCLDNDGDGVFDVRYRIEAGVVSAGLVDTDRDGVGEQRQVYAGGQLSHVEIDTNGDGRADVVRYVADGNVIRRCEDAEFDGEIDRCFEGQSLVELSGVTDVAPPLESLGCGSLHPFWRGR